MSTHISVPKRAPREAKLYSSEKSLIRRTKNGQRPKLPVQKLTGTDSNIGFMNGPERSTLLSFIEKAACENIERGERYRLWILTCYFDVPALEQIGTMFCKAVGIISGTRPEITVAIDVGEWITHRISETELVGRISNASGIAPGSVKVLPVQIPGHLIHAKAYGAIGDRNGSGFVVVTSGNATRRGFGLDPNANLELATVTAERWHVAQFKSMMDDLATHGMSEEHAIRHDDFLRALALFSSGSFYHRWGGALGSEIRFRLTLTAKGKKARRSRSFRGYRSDSDTISTDPLNIEKVFERKPKPFSRSFWRTYSVDTLFGYWVPEPIAQIVDDKLTQSMLPYIEKVKQSTSDAIVGTVAKKRAAEVTRYAKKHWIKENRNVVSEWSARVRQFRENDELIALRLRPYQRVPELLSGESRAAVLEATRSLRLQINSKRKLFPVKSVLAEFLRGRMTRAQLDEEWKRLGDSCRGKVASN
jgi:hypothetical protein